MAKKKAVKKKAVVKATEGPLDVNNDGVVDAKDVAIVANAAIVTEAEPPVFDAVEEVIEEETVAPVKKNVTKIKKSVVKNRRG